MDLAHLILGNAAGTTRSVEDVRDLSNSRITRITVGPITREERLNNKGLQWYSWNLREMITIAHNAGKKLWASVVGFSPKEFVDLAEICFGDGVDGVEFNFEYFDVQDGDVPESIFSYHPDMVEEVLDYMELFRFGGKNISVRLSLIPDEFLDHLIPMLNRSVANEVIVTDVIRGEGAAEIPPHERILQMIRVLRSTKRMSRDKEGASFLSLYSETRVIAAGNFPSAEIAAPYLGAGANGLQWSFLKKDLSFLSKIVDDIGKTPEPETV